MEAREYFEKKHGKMSFGKALKSHRMAEQWTQEDLASKVGVSKVAISQFERGKAYPKPETLKKIAHVFGLIPDSFVRYILQDFAQSYGEYVVEVKRRAS